MSRGEYVTGTGQTLVNVHPPEACAGNPCPIHNPSDHPLKDAPTHWRDDRRIMERICEHRVGHPDPDDEYHRVTSLGENALYSSIHGCCRCCQPKEASR